MTKMGSEGAGVPIPRLSAVAPNERINGDRLQRRWYMLPDFAPRHLPLLFVPRINDGTPFFVSNARAPVLVDANFSTVYERGAAPSAAALLGLLNSSWVRACCEASGSPMGAGALKLEATHLRRLPVPVPRSSAWERLEKLGQELVASTTLDAGPTLHAIDQLIVGTILGDGHHDTITSTCNGITALLDTLRQQRLRKGGIRG
jgi:hypothetical protein